MSFKNLVPIKNLEKHFDTNSFAVSALYLVKILRMGVGDRIAPCSRGFDDGGEISGP